MTQKTFTAIGVMSGTAMDGIDIALIETDGYSHVNPLAGHTYPYAADLRSALQAIIHQPERAESDPLPDLTQAVTTAHAEAIQRFLHDHNLQPSNIDVFGVHGQTIFHAPAKRLTRQLACGQTLANSLGSKVVMKFREADMAAGGQGAPLMPLYHAAIAEHLPKPVMILNLGGVGNVTYLGEDSIIAFDTGPGNALLDDLMRERTGKPYDKNGEEAARGKVDHNILTTFLNQPYFDAPAPKSLDRQTFKPVLAAVNNLPLADALATLAACTIEAAILANTQVPAPAQRWLVTGGGRLNLTLMKGLQAHIPAPVEPIEAIGYSGDFLEAQGFGYLAIRSLLGLPLSLPTTTGVPEAITGGVVYLPKSLSSPAEQEV